MENKTKELELDKLEVEIEEKQIDIQLKKFELEIRKKELISQKKSRLTINTSILVAVVVGIIGVFTSLLNSFQERINQEEIERQKLNSSLILQCTQIDDKHKSLETLQLLLNLGLIKDKDGTLKAIINDTLKVKRVNSSEAVSIIKITDSLKKPIGNAEVYFNNIFVGRTDISGKISIAESSKELGAKDITVKTNGSEVLYIDYFEDRNNNITLRVIPN
jgi:hypothetical protein